MLFTRSTRALVSLLPYPERVVDPRSSGAGYSWIEHEGAAAIRFASDCLAAGDTDTAMAVLEPILINLPRKYCHSFIGPDRALYVKSWSPSDFGRFKRWLAANRDSLNSRLPSRPLPRPEHVRWLPAAFPVACFFAGAICNAQGLASRAHSFLREGLELEPDHPVLLNEMARSHDLTP